jgi:tetratricopeptide (TPR) repeat protein
MFLRGMVGRGIAGVVAFSILASAGRASDVPSGNARVFAGFTPDGVKDPARPRLLAAAAISHINKGNALPPKAALTEYRAALALLERYLAAGGNQGYDLETSLALARGFSTLGDVPDARRCWKLAVSIRRFDAPGYEILESAIDAAARHDYAESLRKLAEGFAVEADGRQYFSTMSISTSDASPDLQFRLGLAALRMHAVSRAKHLFEVARDLDPAFGEPRLYLAVLLLRHGERSRAIKELLIVSTSYEGLNTPDVRSYSEEEAPRAARLLIALTVPRSGLRSRGTSAGPHHPRFSRKMTMLR